MATVLRTLSPKWRYLRSHPAFASHPGRVACRLAVWRLRCTVGAAATVTLPRWGVRLWVPSQWRGISKLVFAFREDYEAELRYVGQMLSRGDTAVDVGANFGIYSLVAARAVGGTGQVLAFEPARETFAVLERNVALNGLRNVRTFRLALSDHQSQAVLHHHADPSRNSLAAGPGPCTGTEVVETTTLDAVLGEQGVDWVRLVKVDVEGAEELVLRGAELVLRRARPIVVFEVNPGAALGLGLSPEGARRFLESLGYRFYTVGSDTDLRPVDSPQRGGNVVAVWGEGR